MLQIGRGKAKLDCLSRDIFDRTWYVLAVGNIDHQRQINRALDCALCMPWLPKQVGWIKDVLKLLASVFFFRPRDWHPEDLKFSGGARSLDGEARSYFARQAAGSCVAIVPLNNWRRSRSRS